MWLVIGLGNPGAQYALTRHNVGFMAVDLLAAGYGIAQWGQEHKAWTAKIKLEGPSDKQLGAEQILLVKPQTFMNLSGTSVQALMTFYKIPIEKILVLQDDIDQPFGAMRFHKNRGHGGHNGIRNISELMGADYTRLKLGVGRPPHPEMNVADYVLQKFSDEEQSKIPDFLNKAGDAVESYIFEGLSKASTKFNG